jgi:hypothetical protein
MTPKHRPKNDKGRKMVFFLKTETKNGFIIKKKDGKHFNGLSALHENEVQRTDANREKYHKFSRSRGDRKKNSTTAAAAAAMACRALALRSLLLPDPLHRFPAAASSSAAAPPVGRAPRGSRRPHLRCSSGSGGGGGDPGQPPQEAVLEAISSESSSPAAGYELFHRIWRLDFFFLIKKNESFLRSPLC